MLIKTKLQVPSLRTRLLDRRDLITRLSVAKGSPLVLLTGPAGSGKTSLACQWIKQENFKAVWYALDEEDNEADIFFRYLLATLIKADEELDGPFGPMLGNQRELEGKKVIPLLIESLAGATDDIHLVLDDFHQIVNQEILASLARLIQYLPDRLHLVVLSRQNLPAAVDVAILKKETLTICASDLKFTEQETEALFKKIIPLDFSIDQIRDLNRHVEGWAAGLQLIGVSLRSKGDNADLSYILNQAHDQVANLLIQDILCSQPERIRGFVLATALLDRFNSQLCDEVTGHADAVGILSHLERLNLFLIPLDAERNWYRYHHMFAEVVRRQVAVEKPGLIPATLRQAAKWFAANNYLEDALRNAFRSQDFEFAAELMEDYISQYIEQYDPMAGIRWILRLPVDILNQRGLLRLHQCSFLLILMEASDLKEILFYLEENKDPAFERYSDTARAFCEDYRAYLRCIAQIFYSGETAHADQLQDLRDRVSTKNQILTSEIELFLTFFFISKGDLISAEASLAKALELSSSYENMWRKLHCIKAKALMAKHRGQLYKAETVANQMLRSLEHQGRGRTPMVFILRRNLGHIYYLQNKLDKARECVDTALPDIEYGVLEEILSGYELRLLIHMAAGENEQAAERIQQIKNMSVKFEMPQIAVSADANAASIAIEQGNLIAAERWARQRNLQLNEPFSLLFAMEALTLARLYLARKDYRQVAQLLDTLRNRCLKRTLHELVLKIDILRSVTFHALDQFEKARSLLQETMLLSETEDYIRPFADDADLIAPVLRLIAEKLPYHLFTSHFINILAACDIPFCRPIVPQKNKGIEYEDLTQREMEILTWIESGYQNKKIAQMACISVNTVKTHVHNILAKLCAETRTQAVLKAKKLGIFRKG